MVRVAPIKLQVGPKVLWFDPNDLDIHLGDDCIVNTSRGLEYGIATSDVLEVSDELVNDLKSPLKKVERLATAEDMEKVRKLERKSDEALITFKQVVQESKKDMHPVLVEFLFEGDKAVFYFEAEERVDFREMVRDLASTFHVRVDMRQIGVRDGARIIGGLGHCGQELCCTRLGGEFSPVSIRMAKEQNLSLNPQKISGVCGRLMCCLRYEFETYKEFNSRAPKMGAKIETPEGIAKVTDINVPSEQISLRFEDGNVLKIPLEDFEPPEEGRRPHKISEEVHEKYVQQNQLQGLDGVGLVDVVNFTGEDIPVQTRPAARLNGESDSASKDGRKRRRRRGRSGKEGSSDQSKNQSNSRSSRSGDAARDQKAKNSSKNPSNKQRRNRQDSQGGGSTARSSNSKKNTSRNNGGSSGSTRQNRPGQKSSGLSSLHERSESSKNQMSASPTHRRSRRRRHTTGGDTHDGGES